MPPYFSIFPELDNVTCVEELRGGESGGLLMGGLLRKQQITNTFLFKFIGSVATVATAIYLRMERVEKERTYQMRYVRFF